MTNTRIQKEKSNTLRGTNEKKCKKMRQIIEPTQWYDKLQITEILDPSFKFFSLPLPPPPSQNPAAHCGKRAKKVWEAFSSVEGCISRCNAAFSLVKLKYTNN